jgi:hypothetical protein
MKAGSYKIVECGLPGNNSKDYYLAFGLAVLTVVLHTWVQLSEFSRPADSAILTSQTVSYLYLVIELGLLVNVIGLWFRTTAGLRVSIIALFVVVVAYAFWYAYSRRILEPLLSKPFYQDHPETVPNHPFGLIGATWPSLVVLLMSGLLFLWEVKTFRRKAVYHP